MGKRSDFERKPRDFYPTPIEAVFPLLGHLKAKSTFVEPCAGDGRLIRHIEKYGHTCTGAYDIEPQAEGIEKGDALFLGEQLRADYIITNPPWSRPSLHDMIDHFRYYAPCWLLFDADWMHTKQAREYLGFCEKIVSVGRVSWEDNGVSGKDNCAWFCFVNHLTETRFYGSTG